MSHDSENWTQLQALFHLAEETPAEERERVLREHCQDERLIARALDLYKSSSELEANAPSTPQPATPGRVGPYTILRLLGSGGIGTVYLAERIAGGTPQRAALKMLAPHAISPSFIERFHREQHILGSLDHAHITRLMDAGLSETGQPYLVMEFVDGEHLDRYCDERKLGITERLQLFLQVCDAVAYAHRNLVVHLDLKPSNILVSREGAIKLLDFGTSKLIQTGSLLTTTVMATPAYASPEQLRNEPVTTACDIYSLGAILFELLTGKRPYANSSVAAIIERTITEQGPESLLSAITAEGAGKRSQSEPRLRQLLRGDLQTIAEKCLWPKPADRYASVDALAGDVRRYLEGSPVLARPQTAIYRIGKFVRRNRAAVTAGAIAALLLIGSATYGAWRQQQALREARRAQTMQTFMRQLFRMANPDYTGKPAATVPELLRLGVKTLPDYIRNPADLRQAQLGLAESMYENGDFDDAKPVFNQIASGAKAAGDLPAEAEAEAYAGHIAFAEGKMEEGKSLTAHALELSHRPGMPPLVRMWSAIYYAWDRDNSGFRDDNNLHLLEYAVKVAEENHLPAHDTADALDNLGQDQELRGNLPLARQTFQSALAAYGQDPTTLCDRSGIQSELGYISEMSGNVPASLPLYKQAWDGYTQCAGADSNGAMTQQEFYAGALVKLGRAQEALPIMEQSMPYWRKAEANSPDLAQPLYYLGRAQIATGHYKEAEATAREMVDVQTGKVEPTDRRFGSSHFLWAQALAGQKRYREALPHAEIADTLLARNAVSQGAKEIGAQAHQLHLQIEEKAAHSAK